MKNKGFTLIELLAVIVILAIIALIATPIIINIINDARESANKRTIELYATAVKNAVAKEQLNGSEVAIGAISDTILAKVQYSGDPVTCTVNNLYKDGSIYIAGCKINNTAVDYTYGTEKQFYKPQYYSWASVSEYIGGNLPSDADTNLSNITIPDNYPFYLGYDTEDGTKTSAITAAYVCFERNDKEYCLRGGSAISYEANRGVLNEAFVDINNACSSNQYTHGCSDDTIGASADQYGLAWVSSLDESAMSCYIEVEDWEPAPYFYCGQV